MTTQANVNLINNQSNRNYQGSNDPNYRFVNFFNLKEVTNYKIGAINDTKNINFTSSVPIQGNQTIESCKLNATTLYNKINSIDYTSSSNYNKGVIDCVKVAGRMNEGGSVNVDYFSQDDAVFSFYDFKELVPNVDLNVDPNADPNVDPNANINSVELFGYIVAPASGNYSLNIKPEFDSSLELVLAWIRNSAENSYRETNTTFKKNGLRSPIYLTKGVFVPIRIQFISTAGISVFPFTISDDKGHTISDYYSLKSDKKKKQVVFSLTRNPDTTTSCNMYTEGNIENYGINKSVYETGKESNNIEVRELKRWNLSNTTETVGLDTLGNLVEYDVNNIVINTIISSGFVPNQNPIINNAFTYDLYLTVDNTNNIKLRRWYRNRTSTSSNRTVFPLPNPVTNPDWNRYSTSVLSGSDRITVSNPIVSPRKWYLLILVKSATSTSLVLYGSNLASTNFYGLNIDNKLGKTFYANKNASQQYLREVPKDLLSYSSTSMYATYSNYYPLPDNTYTGGKTQNCRTECNSDPNCTHTYNVNDTAGTKCLLSSEPVIYAPKQSNTPYTQSTLYVKGQTLNINNMTDKSFQNVRSENGSITGFNDYTINLPLTKDSIAFTKGEPDYITLQNQINNSTSNQIKQVRPQPDYKNMKALEGFTYTSLPTNSSSTIVQNISGQLVGLQGQIVNYSTLQNRVSNLARDISSTTMNINSQYASMDNANDSTKNKYDFTGSTIYALEDDYSLAPALLKDNALLSEGQNNLNIVGTITMATLLIAAIFISK
jgi:hypothetical protein